MKRKKYLNLPVILMLLVCGLGTASAQSTSFPKSNEGTWLQWRGNTRDGRISSTLEWPSRLSSDSLTQQWRIPLGPSYSGPIVTESLVFTTETKNKKLEIVRAFDHQTGKQRWEQSWEGQLSVPFFAKSNGDWIRSTLAGHRQMLVQTREKLSGVDLESGDVLWSKTIPAFRGMNILTPLVSGDSVFTSAYRDSSQL